MVTAILLTGCGSPLFGCIDILNPSVVVMVISAVDGTAQADGASGEIVDGSFEFELTQFGPTELISISTDRRGTYTVFVRKEGFLEWAAEGIEVRGDGCTAKTRRLTAELIPT